MGAFAAALQNIARPYVPDWNKTYEGINALRDLQAKNALAGIYRQAIDPSTGAFDQSRFNAMVGASPEASWRAGEAMQQAGTAMTTQGQGAQQQFVAQQQRLTALSGLATPMMERAEKDPSSVSMGDLSGLLDTARRGNLITDGDVAQARTLMAQPGANPTDILRGWYFRNYSALQQMQQAKGMGLPYQLTPEQALQPRVVTINGVPTTVPSGRLMGVPGLGGVSATGLGGTGFGGAAGLDAPGKEAALNNIMMRESGGRDVPNAQFGEHAGGGLYQIVPSTWAEGKALAGIPANQYPIATGAPAEVQHAVASALWDKYGETPWAQSAGNASKFPGFDAIQTARHTAFSTPAPYQVASAGPNIPPPPTRPAVSGVTPAAQPVPTGGGQPGWEYPSPYVTPQYEQSSKDFLQAQGLNKSLGVRISPLQQAISLLKANPDLMTGPATEDWTRLIQGLRAQGIDVGDAEGADRWQMLAKALARNLTSQFGADPTDVARLTREASQPNTQMGRDALWTMAAEQIGYERMRTVQYLEYKARHPGGAAENHPEFFNQETADWAATQDPVAYGADLMPQTELNNYLTGLNKDQRKAFADSLNNAKRLFRIRLPLPTGGQGGGG